MASTTHPSARVRNPEHDDRNARAPVPDPTPTRSFDRHLGLALLLVALVVIPRSLSIAWAHSETYDEAFHLRRGIAFLTRTLAAKGSIPEEEVPLGDLSLPYARR
jgi:hypothetical protein